MSTRDAASELAKSIQSDVATAYTKLAQQIKSLNKFKALIIANLGVLWLLVAAVITEGAKDGVVAAQTDMAWVTQTVCPEPPREEYVDPLPQPIPPDPPVEVKRRSKPVAKPAPTKINDVKPTPTAKMTANVEEYVNRYAKLAQQEQAKFGIPASISLAQGIIESKSGTSTLAVKNNNHFGIKCHSRGCKRGHCTNHPDDSHKDFFRKFPNAWESWRAHSLVVKNTRYTKHLKTFGYGYEGWAEALKKGGYATDPKYATTLISVIKRYDLHNYDTGAKLPSTVIANATRVKPATYTLATPK